jgi:hypothetical protein
MWLVVIVLPNMDLVFESSHEVSSGKGRDFRVVILCEDAASTDKACDVLRLLRHNLKEEAGRLLYQWWNFEFLAVQELWDMFAEQTAAADMIIIGLPEQLLFPERFATWLQRLPELRKTFPGAMIAVLDSAPQDPGAEPEICSQLQQAAVLSRMDFFATPTAAGMQARILPSPLWLHRRRQIRMSGG